MKRFLLLLTFLLGLVALGFYFFVIEKTQPPADEEVASLEVTPPAPTVYHINRAPKEKSSRPNVMRQPVKPISKVTPPIKAYSEEVCVEPIFTCSPCEKLPSLFGFAAYHFGKSLVSVKNFTRVGFYYLPDLTEKRWGTYFQVDGAFLENGTQAETTGIGLRYRDSRLNWVWGVNAFGDVRFTDITTFFQYGVGFELYTPCFDFHLNGYIPAGSSTRKSSPYSYSYGDNFGVTIFTEEYLYRGVDALLGRYLGLTSSLTLWGGVGGYYLYDGIDDSIPGFQLRGELWYRSYLFAGFLYTYDGTFRSRGEGRIGLSIPLTELANCFGSFKRVFDRGYCRGSYLNGRNGKMGPIPRLGAGCIPGRGSKYQTTNF